MNLHIIYRISDVGYSKVKPAYINNENCLRNAVMVFPNAKFHVIADNVSEETYAMICRYVQSDEVTRVSIGHGAGTFNVGLDLALTFPDEDIVYHLENDYLHLPGSERLIQEILNYGASYCSLYDHPDKYRPPSLGGNPFVDVDGGEATKVYCIGSSHWKITNSTTMTFACKVRVLKQDIKTLRKWTNKGHCPNDFKMFLELRKKGRALMTPIPGFSTHGETLFLSPFTDWESIALSR
jgi:hypothetical protein